MLIRDLAATWQHGLSTSLIDENTAQKFIIEAALEYQAWGIMRNDSSKFDDDGIFQSIDNPIHADTDLTPSEWGVIKPLAELFVERESALMQEASRVASHEPYGRTSSEITQDIQNYRNEYMRRWAFSFPPSTI